MNKSCHGKLSTYTLLALFFAFACSNASAAFVDNFEDGNANGWMETSIGSGSTGVELHNASQMAFATHTGSGLHLLSMDFNYLDSGMLSFDMHAVAYPAGGSNAKSGVTISFMNNFNVVLGSIGFINATSSSLLGLTDNPIDNLQHYFGASMSDFSALAGLGAADPISKISLAFFAQAQTTGYFGDNSIAGVWFDNVAVAHAPLPAAVWLFGSGLLGFLGVSRRKRA